MEKSYIAITVLFSFLTVGYLA